MIALLLLIVALTSQPPAPSAGKREGGQPQQQTQPGQTQAAAIQQGTEGAPLVVRVAKSQHEAAQEQRDREDKAADKWWTIGLGGLTVLVMVGQLVVYKIQANRLRDTIDKMDAIAKDQTKDMKASIHQATRAAEAMEKSAEASRTAADAAKDNAIAARHTAVTLSDTLATSRQIERAYVTMSHQPPGLIVDRTVETGQDQIPKRRTYITLVIKNYGNTPARITDVIVRLYFGLIEQDPKTGAMLPDIPPLPKSGSGERAFLVKEDSYIIQRDFIVTETEWKGVQGETMLWIIGTVDYIDQFDVRHRAGYARFYNPAMDDRDRLEYQSPIPPNGPWGEIGIYTGLQLDRALYNRRNNLMFAAFPGYNYDRPRQQGEGNDWNEPTQ